MVARIQKAMVLATLLAMALWWHWAAPHSPGWALAGVALPLLLHASVLGLQFVLMQRANVRAHAHARAAASGSDGTGTRGSGSAIGKAGGRLPAPLASGAQQLRAWGAEVGASLRLFCWHQPFRSQAEPDLLVAPGAARPGPPLRGVVLVHGFLCNRGVWRPWLRALRARGQVCEAVNLEPMLGGIDDHVPTLDAAVQRATRLTGRAPVLVCHSMGGLVARAWLRSVQDDARVHRVITLATPHQGTALADFAYSPNGRQMQVGGDWLALLQAAESPQRAALFTCWYSNCDNIVFPSHTATLPGADNRLLPGAAHVQMATHPQVLQVCLDELARD